MESSNITVKLTVRGSVQGVGYRYFVAQNAKELSIVGYAENDSSGDVTVVATGERESIDTLKTLCQKGPSGANVSEVNTEEILAPQPFQEFYIRY